MYEWDTVLSWILYAYREVSVETLGFRPFELLFGKNPRGMLTLIRDACTSNDADVPTSKRNVVECMLTLRDGFADAIEIANKTAKEHQNKSKNWYDRKARSRQFKTGEQILMFLPISGKPLEAQFEGPFTVLQQIGPVDYMIATPGRRRDKRLVYVNLLKK